jgi:four helix bundle protein
MRPHERLDVWRKAIDLVVIVYEITEKFPDRERYGLTSQIRRASVSISANIAEGAARTFPKEFLHFLSNAQGSASEVSTELLIANRVGILEREAFRELDSQLDEIGRMLSGLKKHIRSRLG